MKKTAFIWRESVYKDGFHCNKCGGALAMPDGQPLGSTLTDVKNGLLICPDCGNIVAKIKEVDVPENMAGLQGFWSAFENDREK